MRLLGTSHSSRNRQGRRYRYPGGQVIALPAGVLIPRAGRRHAVIGHGGNAGELGMSPRVLDEARGFI